MSEKLVSVQPLSVEATILLEDQVIASRTRFFESCDDVANENYWPAKSYPYGGGLNASFRNRERLQKPLEQGFTLIELIIVVSILSVVSAIAIPQYGLYKGEAYDAMAHHALRVTATAEEAYFVDNNEYVDCNQATCPILLPNLSPYPDGVQLEMTAELSTFTGTASHTRGTGVVYRW